VILQQLMQTVRTLEAERRQVLRLSVSTWTEEDKSSTGRVWAAEFHRVTAHSHLTHILKLINHLFPQFSTFFSSP
jgi:hypothetical protein